MDFEVIIEANKTCIVFYIYIWILLQKHGKAFYVVLTSRLKMKLPSLNGIVFAIYEDFESYFIKPYKVKITEITLNGALVHSRTQVI